MLVKKGKQMKLEMFDNYNVNLGTVDNKNPKALYVTVSAWGKPINLDDDNYTVAIKKLNKDIKKKVYEALPKNLFDGNRTIVDFEIKESGISNERRSYMNCEITLYKLNNFKIQSNLINDAVKSVTTKVITEVFDLNPYFTFHKTKK
jgi:hypothetical protein